MKSRSKQLVICVDNEGYEASREKRKIYVTLRDPVADKLDMLRIIDESARITFIRKPSFARSPFPSL
ncbi:hypothetical protein [Bradyrhizobium nanningense]|uniref:hypothetical protein n=1 Tax=Bradyrhizobium nanningense TaxID=1325118 RepID=UPI001ABF7367|nr:hypothetical protein [Bradyrhizobium nanningense]